MHISVCLAAGSIGVAVQRCLAMACQDGGLGVVSQGVLVKYGFLPCMDKYLTWQL